MKWLALVLFCVSSAAGAQEDYRTISFHFERPGLAVPAYTFRIFPNEVTQTVKNGINMGAAQPEPPARATGTYTIEGAGAGPSQKLELNEAATAKLLALVKDAHGLARCDAHRKGIADTGTKTLRVHEAYSEHDVSCTYNYSEDKAVVELTSLFQGMAVTLDAGRQMTRDEKYDRLALDKDMTLLVEEVKDGRALGLSNIRATLQGLVDDPAVLERVRMQADKLLQQSLVSL